MVKENHIKRIMRQKSSQRSDKPSLLNKSIVYFEGSMVTQHIGYSADVMTVGNRTTKEDILAGVFTVR